MGIAIFPAPVAGSKTAFRTMLTSGTSYTVPAGVTYLNVTLQGGGGGGSTNQTLGVEGNGRGGETVVSTLSATAGASIAYTIGAGGAASGRYGNGSAGGTTTFTGATSAAGGAGGQQVTGSYSPAASNISFANNGGQGAAANPCDGKAGGSGYIIVEYWA